MSCKVHSLRKIFSSQVDHHLILNQLCPSILPKHTLVHLQPALSLRLDITRSGLNFRRRYPLGIRRSRHWSPQLVVTPCHWPCSLLWLCPVHRGSSMVHRFSSTLDNRHSTKHMYLRPT